MKGKLLVLLFLFTAGILFRNLEAQNITIGIDGTNSSALLNIESSEQGILIPRMTLLQRNLIKTPAEGLLIYNTTDNTLDLYIGLEGWYNLENSFIGIANGTSAIGGGMAINADGTPPNESAILDVKSTFKGFLLPRLNQNITPAEEGLMYFNVQTKKLTIYNGSNWNETIQNFSNSTIGSGIGDETGVLISENGETIPHHSAMLELRTIQGKGLLIPRMNETQRIGLSSEAGLIIYNTDSKRINYCTGSEWRQVNIETCGFICGNSYTDQRDGNIYNTLQIGNQCWFEKNLAYLPSVVASTSGSDIIPYYYVYGYNGTNVATAKSQLNYSNYGVLYNWTAAVTACPNGWFLPSDNEWKQFELYLGMSQSQADGANWRGATQGTMVKATQGWNLNGNGNNSSGFTALAGGYRYSGGSFLGTGVLGYWWSSTGSLNATIRGLMSSSSQVYRGGVEKGFGNSVRCVKDLSYTTVPQQPSSGIHVPEETQIQWNWNSVSGATGYKYNITNNYATATDNGLSLSYLQTGLTCGSAYTLYVWAYNSCGNSNVLILTQNTLTCPFVCGTSTITDNRDGNIYNTVLIGTQCWMKENLKYLPSVIGPTTGSETIPYNYVYGYSGTDVTTAKATLNYNTYGVLYNWTAAMNGAGSSSNNPSGVQGVCPNNWHIPSETEWEQLELQLGMVPSQLGNTGWRGSDQGTKLKSTSGWNSGGNGTNTSGFSALPNGYRYSSGIFNYSGSYGYWWSSTENSSTNTWDRELSSNFIQVGRYSSDKSLGFAVRCVKDCQLPVPSQPSTGNIIPSKTQIEWNWTGIPNSIGYKYNTINNFYSAIDNGTSLNFTQTGLNCGTSYSLYVWAYNSCGSSTVLTLTQNTSPCGTPCSQPTITDGRDGNIYNTVLIGTQCWLRENLKYLPSVVSPDMGSTNIPYNYVYGYSGTDVIAAKATFNYNTYGVLYNWAAAMNGASSSSNNPSGVQGICPLNWHLPSDAEWKQLEIQLGMTQTQADATGWRGTVEGNMLKQSGTSLWNNPNTGANNSSGFTALPAGIRIAPAFGNIKYFEYWWSSSDNTLNANIRYLNYTNSKINRDFYNKDYGFSVRCVKDCEISPATPASGTHVSSETQIQWNWNSVSGVTGYKYNTTNNYLTAIDNGLSTSYVQTGLTCGSTYILYVWAYNSCGNSDALILTQNTLTCPFICGTSSITDNRDNNAYTTVQIGDQCWMKENLKYLPSVVGPGTISEINPCYYVYGYNGTNIESAKATSNYSTFGVLYNWSAAMAGAASSDTNPSSVQGICPTNWHFPSDTEWKQLELQLGMTQLQGDATGWRGTDEGGKLKQADTVLWNSPNTGATNSSNFSALPSGYLDINGNFNDIGNYGFWWSSAESSTTNTWSRSLTTNNSKVYRGGNSKKNGFSIRCIKN